MKKFIFMLVAMVVVVAPMGVEAFADIKPGKTETTCDSNDLCTVTAEVMIEPQGSDPAEFKFDVSYDGTVKEGRLVKSVSVLENGENFNLEITGDLADNTAKLSINEPTYSLTGSEHMATIQWTYQDDVDKTQEDCSVVINWEGASITVYPEEENPQTGIELPYILLGVAAVAGIGVYMVSRKNTKLFKI